MGERFTIHHVGARFGSYPFPAPPSFVGEVVLYDADEDCVEGVTVATANTPHMQVVAAALSDVDGEAELRLTLNATPAWKWL